MGETRGCEEERECVSREKEEEVEVITALFCSAEFASLKVKSLEEIRNEKPKATITTIPHTSQGTPHTLTSIPPTSTTTSFQLTSVLKTTGIRVGGKEGTVNSVQKTVMSQPQAKPAGITMAVREGKSLFSSEKNPSSVFSPNYQPGGGEGEGGGGGEEGRGGEGGGGGLGGDMFRGVHMGASISWGDVRTGEEEGGKKEGGKQEGGKEEGGKEDGGKEMRMRMRLLERAAPESLAKKVWRRTFSQGGQI